MCNALWDILCSVCILQLRSKVCIPFSESLQKNEFKDQGKFNLFCLLGSITIVCSLWRAVLNERTWYLGKIRQMYTYVQKFSLNAWLFLLEHQWVFESSVIVVNEFLSVRRWISKSYSNCWKGFKYTTMLENQRIWGSWRIFLKNSRKFNCSGQTRDSWTTITKQKNTAVDHSGNNTVLRIKHMLTFERGLFYKLNIFFLLWTTCKHLLCEMSYLGQY